MNNQEIKIDSKNLLFQPWVGKQYESGGLFNIPILIVGESNYADDEEKKRQHPHSEFTRRLIKETIDGSRKLRFFSYLQQMFVENATDKDLREEFWHSVAHHEYIQDWLPRPRVRPSKEMWEKAEPVFQDVVDKLKPKCILFVKSVYDRVSSKFESSTPAIDLSSSHPSTLKLYGSSHPIMRIDNALASWVYHPCAQGRGGFRRARGIVSPLLEAAEKAHIQSKSEPLHVDLIDSVRSSLSLFRYRSD